MDTLEIKEVYEMGTVAPPMVIGVAVKKGDNSKFAVKWALDQFMSPGQTLILLHVRARLLAIPTPMGNRVPISQVSGDAVAAYMQEVNSQTNALFSPYRRLCNAKKVKTVLAVAEGDDVASAIIRQISIYGICKFVIGSSPSNVIIRKFKGPDVPATVAKNAPNFCTIYAISKGKLISVRSATCTEFKTGNPDDSSHHPSVLLDMSASIPPRTGETNSIQNYSQLMPFHENQSRSNINQVMRSHSAPNPASTISNVKSRKSGSISINQTSSTAAVNESGTGRFSISRSEGYSEYSSTMRIEERESPNNTEVPSTKHSMLLQLIYTLLDILGAYVKANKLTFQRIEDARKVEEAEKREKIARTIAEEEKAKSEMAMRRAETAIQLAEKEAQQRRDAELRATMESEERKKAQEALAFTPPNHFFCPILQEVMDEPYVAADGFTYEYRTIKTWLKKHNTSPMTNLSLSHKYLVPNHSLRSAILEWKTTSGFNCSDL